MTMLRSVTAILGRQERSKTNSVNISKQRKQTFPEPQSPTSQAWCELSRVRPGERGGLHSDKQKQILPPPPSARHLVGKPGGLPGRGSNILFLTKSWGQTESPEFLGFFGMRTGECVNV